jgi:hypothetical protein
MSAIDKQILVETVSIAALRLSERNPRSHSKGQIRQLARSIERFGFNVPILVDGTNGVIAGGLSYAGVALGIVRCLARSGKRMNKAIQKKLRLSFYCANATIRRWRSLNQSAS